MARLPKKSRNVAVRLVPGREPTFFLSFTLRNRAGAPFKDIYSPRCDSGEPPYPSLATLHAMRSRK